MATVATLTQKNDGFERTLTTLSITAPIAGLSGQARLSRERMRQPPAEACRFSLTDLSGLTASPRFRGRRD